MSDRNTELQAITDTINLYADGVHNREIEKLKKAFHPRAMMYGRSVENVTILEIQALFDFVAANPPIVESGEPHVCTIEAIFQSGMAASVEMTETSAYGNDYTNFFQLLKIDGNWVIMSKTYFATASKVVV